MGTIVDTSKFYYNVTVCGMSSNTEFYEVVRDEYKHFSQLDTL